MNKIEVICSDVDGTLLSSNKELTEQNLDAILQWQQAGNYFGIVSGRQISGIKKVYVDKFNPDFVIGLNGGYIKNLAGDVIFNNISLEHQRLLIVRLEALNILQIHVTKAGKTTNINITEFIPTPEIEKISIVLNSKAESDNLMKKLIDLPLNITQSDYRYIEISEGGISKLSGIKTAIGSENLNKVAAVGDFYNDIEMITAAGVGVAMANAVPEVKEAADMITTSNDDDGIAHLINKLLEK